LPLAGKKGKVAAMSSNRTATEPATAPLSAEEIAISALREIREKYGKVCEEYLTCKHPACESSYGAWAIADEALRQIREAEAEQRQKKVDDGR
jgi:hypothetical protein